MPIYKVNFFFESRSYGWSETYYVDKTDANQALDEAKGTQLANRVRVLGGANVAQFPRLTAIRISNIEIQRDSLVYAVPVANGINPLGADEGDNPNLAIVLRMEAGDKYRRQLYLRGNPDSLVKGGIYSPADAGTWLTDFNRWKNKLIDDRWGMLAVTKPDTASDFTGMDVYPGGQVLVTTALNHGLVVNNTVRIVAAPGTTGFRGTYTVVGVPLSNAFAVVGSFAGTYRGGGKWYKRDFTLRPFTNIQPVRATHRITGRPFDSPVGRRKRRARV